MTVTQINPMTSKYYAAPVQETSTGDGYEKCPEPWDKVPEDEVSFWSVYEREEDGTEKVIADFYGGDRDIRAKKWARICNDD